MIEVAAPVTPAEVKKAAEGAIAACEKEFGKGIVFGMNDRVGQPVPNIPTGIYEVDYNVLGVGGLPKGRIVEIYGPESSGKTTLALLAVASAQRSGGMAAFVDVEHALSPDWATKNGCNMKDLLVSQPDYGEQALQVTEMLVTSGAFPIIVVDSVAALIPKAELDGEIGDAHVGLQARLMSQAMRKLTGVVSKTNTLLIFINQIREKIGVTWGSPETTAGGRALKFYASVRLDVRRIGMYKIGETVVGNKTKIKCAKNKVSPPFREAEVNLLFDQGFDCDGSLVDAAISAKIVEKAGSWFSYKGDRIGQGRDNAIASLREAGLLGQILTEVRAKATEETA